MRFRGRNLVDLDDLTLRDLARIGNRVGIRFDVKVTSNEDALTVARVRGLLDDYQDVIGPYTDEFGEVDSDKLREYDEVRYTALLELLDGLQALLNQ